MVSTIIAKANARDKVIDFRDNLSLANVEDYAMMHGIGGEKFARTSVIKVVICDYSAGTGDASKTVEANISPATCAKLLEVCKKNIGTIIVDDGIPPIAEQRAYNKNLKKIADMQFEVLQHVLKLSKSIAAAVKTKNQAPGIGPISEGLSGMLAKAKAHVLAPDAPEQRTPYFKVPAHCDITHVQDRVHSAKRDASGFAPVQRLTIAHSTYRQDGKLSNYPWSVKIVNGMALVRVSDTGATTFDSSTLRDSTEAFIMLSDDDMFRCMDRIIRFVDAWEKLKCLPLIKAGLAQRQAEYDAYMSRQQEGA